LQVITNSGSAEQQRTKAREIVNEFGAAKIDSIPTNQLLQTVGRLSAAVLVLGEEGDESDIERLIPLINLQVPSSAVQYLGDIGVSSLRDPNGTSERQKFPACDSLSNILRKSGAGRNQIILNSAANNEFSMQSTLRILGVLIDAKSASVREYADQIILRFGDRALPGIQELETQRKSYWSADL
jgi:hypothetical protein